QGVSGAILPLCFGLVRERLPPERTAFGVALLSATATAGSGMAFLLSGFLVDVGGWRWIFFASAICGAAALLCVSVGLPAMRVARAGGRLDLLGGVLFAPGLLGVLLALTNGSRWGWASPGVLASAGGGAFLLALWVVHE